MLKPIALTIAGSDSGGGAGIQADLKTFTSLGVYGTSVITAVTAQNTLEVERIDVIPPEGVEAQLRAVLTDLPPKATKTGMLTNASIIEIVSKIIKEFKVENLVIDPVMVAKSGDRLLEEDAVKNIIEKLFPLAEVITPNVPEAEVILEEKITSLAAMEKAAQKLLDFGPKWVVLKGGHLKESERAVDIIAHHSQTEQISAPYIPTKNTHGTGCTFSAAIAANLAKGFEHFEAIKYAKELISWGIAHALDLGHGHGPTNHFYFEAGFK